MFPRTSIEPTGIILTRRVSVQVEKEIQTDRQRPSIAIYILIFLIKREELKGDGHDFG